MVLFFVELAILNFIEATLLCDLFINFQLTTTIIF